MDLPIQPCDTVIFDVDDTLGHFTRSFDTWLSEVLGIRIPLRTSEVGYSLTAPYKDYLKGDRQTSTELLEAFEATGRIASPEHFKPTSVVEFAKKIIPLKSNIMAMTARGWMRDGKATTSEWLKQLGIEMSVHVLGIQDSKADLINQMIRTGEVSGNIWLFEDNAHHISKIRQLFPPVDITVVDQPHNRHILHAHYDRWVDPDSTRWIDKWPN